MELKILANRPVSILKTISSSSNLAVSVQLLEKRIKASLNFRQISRFFVKIQFLRYSPLSKMPLCEIGRALFLPYIFHVLTFSYLLVPFYFLPAAEDKREEEGLKPGRKSGLCLSRRGGLSGRGKKRDFHESLPSLEAIVSLSKYLASSSFSFAFFGSSSFAISN